MHYCITYDISSDRTRLRVIKMLKQAGLIRVQKSVFMGISPPHMIHDLKQNTTQLLLKTDKFCIIPLDKNSWGSLQLLGLNPSKMAISRGEMAKFY